MCDSRGDADEVEDDPEMIDARRDAAIDRQIDEWLMERGGVNMWAGRVKVSPLTSHFHGLPPGPLFFSEKG